MSAELIVNALVLGAAAGASSTATTAVTDAYAGVKHGVRRLFRRAAQTGDIDGDPDVAADELFAQVETNPEASKDLLTTLALGSDAELVATARRLVDLADQPPKYDVTLHDSTGVQVGDHNQMTINPGEPRS
ncbi:MULTISPECIES: RIP homotypic interaction motif-containing protein [unclassified Amycolatopsis]|uniref:RIP homotypic interaction motif-containing protein n=1 Tax=unclassified Amycolatopsis TaxID=2618356 RepID=UPI002E21F6CC|nr:MULTISPECIES: RIP homotypic interaction motif-containing protein [unclassified Amycolatopsis]